MNKEEAKQYLRDQINSCIKIQSEYVENDYFLCYNMAYLRALKLSKIIGKPVNKEDFNSGEVIFGIDNEYEKYWIYSKIRNSLKENYSKNYYARKELIEEVFKEYEEYKGYKHF